MRREEEKKMRLWAS